MAVISITEKNFEEIRNSQKTVLIDFFADWCGPCKMVSPIVDKIAEEYPEYIVGKVNVDDEPDLAESFGVMSIPTLVVLKEGEVAAKQVGVQPKEKILEMLK
ncbi:MAG: thioredoxin [Lachnospiraceae bacterium]|nr:thioredoxin [Lachnospiraceae bacterium]